MGVCGGGDSCGNGCDGGVGSFNFGDGGGSDNNNKKFNL